MYSMKSAGAIDFRGINAAALRNGRKFVQGLLPGGKFSGNEYVVKNPRRDDRAPGSFKINIRTGVWKDFASGEGGADLISLVAYNDNIGQGEAARKLAHRMGIEPPNVGPKSNGHGATNGHDSSCEQNTILTTVPADAPAAPTEHFEPSGDLGYGK
jgi:putative DNA primase/helicase